MSKLFKTFSLVILVAAVAACQPAKIVNTPSGRPEIVVKSNNLDKIKDALVNEVSQSGFMVESDNKYNVVFSRPADDTEDLLLSMMIGNSYSSRPTMHLKFNILKVSEGYKLMGFYSASTQMAFGQTKSYDFMKNNKIFNGIYRTLENVKCKFEKDCKRLSAEFDAKQKAEKEAKEKASEGKFKSKIIN